MSILVFCMCVGAGWLLVRALTAGAFRGPGWAAFLAELSMGALFGSGLGSIVCFGLVLAGAATQVTMLAGLGVLVLAAALLWWRLTPSDLPAGVPEKRFPWTWVLLICTGIAVVFLVLDFQAASTANPQGEWDAMSIWNLRARYFASGGDLWRRAMSSEIGGRMVGAAHPGYPMFLSGLLAFNWLSAGVLVNAWDTTLPIAVSLFISLAVLALLGSSVACRKSVALGALAWLILLTSEIFASQTSAQYSDLLQALAFLATLVLMEAAAEVSAPRILIAIGLAAGLAAWIKNEGLPFALAALLVGVWRFRFRSLPWLALGAVPGFAALAVLKSLAQGADATFPHDAHAAIVKIAQPERWWQAFLGFGKAIYDAGGGITHPVLLGLLLAVTLRFIPAGERWKRAWLWIPVAVTAAAEYGLYLVTESDLNWHISTSVSRLVAQLWPSLIWLFVWSLQAPEDLAAIESAPPPKLTSRKRSARQAVADPRPVKG